MSTTILADATELVVLRCWCGIQHAVPKTLRDEQLRKRDASENVPGIYCPLGHTHVPAGKSRTKELEEQLQRERQQHDQQSARLRELAESERRRSAAARGQVTRFKLLVKSGVCPCCRRPFANLQQHMAKQHPDFDPEKLAEVS